MGKLNILEFDEFLHRITDGVERVNWNRWISGDSYPVHLWETKIKNNPEDSRYFGGNKQTFLEFYYDFLIEGLEKLAKEFFDRRLAVDMSKFKAKAKKFESARYLRNFNFDLISNVSYFDAIGIVEYLKIIYSGPTIENGNNIRHMFFPCLVDAIRKKNYDTICSMIRRATATASIFAPKLYHECLLRMNVRDGRNSIFVPTASWGSPAIIFPYIDYNRMVIVDVIPQVLETCEAIYSELDSHVGIFDSGKQLETICSPSEKLLGSSFERENSGKFDAVFFCPPYYDLEDYKEGEQSIKSYKTYEEWLDNYWHKTVELCFNLLRDGGVFSYVIGNKIVSPKDGILDFGNDLKQISEQFFGYVGTYDVVHSHAGNSVNSNIKESDKVQDYQYFFRKNA